MDTFEDTYAATAHRLPLERSGLLGVYDRLVNGITGALDGWFTGFAARLAFASVIFLYYLNSAWSGMDHSIMGLFKPGFGSYAAVFPAALDATGGEPSQLSFFHHAVVYAANWGEFFLPIMIVIGLLTRIAAIGMIAVVVVQSFVDVYGHGLGEKFIGAPFDRLPDAIIFDQRLLWIFVLGILALHGAGKLSVDYLLTKRASAA